MRHNNNVTEAKSRKDQQVGIIVEYTNGNMLFYRLQYRFAKARYFQTDCDHKQSITFVQVFLIKG